MVQQVKHPTPDGRVDPFVWLENLSKSFEDGDQTRFVPREAGATLLSLFPMWPQGKESGHIKSRE